MFKKWITSYKSSLFEVDSKNLTSGSKASLIAFIIIVFIIIGSGVNMQVSYIAYPSKQFGYSCTGNISKNRAITAFQNRDIKKDLYGTRFTYQYWRLSDFKYNHHQQSENDILRQYGTNALCQQLGTHFLDVANDEQYRDRLVEYNALEQSLQNMNAGVARKEKEYGNMLLEDIADQPDAYSILSGSSDSVKKEILSLQNKISKVTKRIEMLDAMNTLPSFAPFKRYLDENSDEIERLHARALRYYKLHYTMNIFLFLIPTWLMFYIVYRLFKRKNRHILAHLSVHVANVTALYTLFYLLSLIYDIIPKVFFSKLIDLLSRYNLTILFNLVAIVLFMTIFGLFIYRIQKNRSRDLHQASDKRAQKVVFERITAGLCSNCGLKTDPDDVHCGRCGHALQKECSSCHAVTRIDDHFCRSCGEKL